MPETATEGPVDFSTLFGGADTRKLSGDLAELTRKKIAIDASITGATERRQEGDRSRATAAYDAMGVGPEKLQPWNVEQEREKFYHDPISSFGSLASVFAIAASKFTHAPMENALNASAAVINAVKANDDKEYERAHTAWKENMDLVKKRFDMQNSLYNDALSLWKTDMSAGEAKLRNAAIRFGDLKTLTMLDAGMHPEIIQLQAQRLKNMEEMQSIKDKFDESSIRKRIFEGSGGANDGAPPEVIKARWENAYGVNTPFQKVEFNTFLATKKPDGSYPTPEESIVFVKKMQALERSDTIPKLGAEYVKSRAAALLREHPDWSAEKATLEANHEWGVSNKADPKGGSKPIPQSMQKDLASKADTHAQVEGFLSTFKPEYSGYGSAMLGDAAMSAARQWGIGGEQAKDAAEWWSNYAKYRNVVRNKLFGSALTAHEASEWDKADINPGTQPDMVGRNLMRQLSIVDRGIEREAASLAAQGFSKEAIQAQLGFEVDFAKIKAMPKAIPVGNNPRNDPDGTLYDAKDWRWQKKGPLVVPIEQIE